MENTQQLSKTEQLFKAEEQILEIRKGLEQLEVEAKEELKEVLQAHVDIGMLIKSLGTPRSHEEASSKVSILLSILKKPLNIKENAYTEMIIKLDNDKETKIYLKGNKISRLEGYNSKKTNYNYYGFEHILQYTDNFLDKILPLCDGETKDKLKLFFKFHKKEEKDIEYFDDDIKSEKKIISTFDRYSDNLSKDEIVLNKISLDTAVVSLHWNTLYQDGSIVERQHRIGFREDIRGIDKNSLVWFSNYQDLLLKFYKEVTDKINKDFAERKKVIEDYKQMIILYQLGEML